MALSILKLIVHTFNIELTTNIYDLNRKNKFTTMNFETTKHRIMHFIKYKGISLRIFFEQTGIRRGFLDGDKLEGAVSDQFLTKIIAQYPELNLRWLITGEGEMLRRESYQYTDDTTPMRTFGENGDNEYGPLRKRRGRPSLIESQIEERLNQKAELQQEVERLTAQIDSLNAQLESRDNVYRDIISEKNKVYQDMVNSKDETINAQNKIIEYLMKK